MAPNPQVVIVAEHPSRTVGFATVARHVADELNARGWRVHYVGVAPPATSGALAYEVHPAVEFAEAAAVVARLLGTGHDERGHDDAGASGSRVIVLCIARDHEVVELDVALRDLGARQRLRLIFHVAVDYAPAPPTARELDDRLDLLVPTTHFGHRVMAAFHTTTDPIPHGVDSATFRPHASHERDEVRDRLGIELGARVVGTFSRNSQNKRLDLAAQVVAHLAHGTSAICGRCGRTAVGPLDPLTGEVRPPTTCTSCRSPELAPTAPVEGLVWQLHAEHARDVRRAAGGWDLDALIDTLALHDVVRWDTARPFADGIDVTDLAARMATCDVHLLLSDAGGWELTMLETAACGVPNVVSDAGAYPEYTAPFARIVPRHDRVLWGHRGEADVGAAVAAVRTLLADHGRRSELGGQGVAVAAAHRWQVVGARWDALLRPLAVP